MELKMKKNRLVFPLLSVLLAMPLQARDLMDVYNLALVNDPQLQEAKERLESVRQGKVQARARLLPTISLGGEIDGVRRDVKTSPTGGVGTSSYSDKSLGLNLSQPLYHRDYWIQLEQADHSIAQSEAEYAAAQIDLMVRSSSAYFDILAAQDILRVAKAQTEANARQLDQATQRFDVGLIAITDVHEAQASHDGARAEEIAAENAVDNAWEALFEIIGQAPQEALAELGEKLKLDPPTPTTLQAWSDTAQAQNYTIIAARNGLESTRKNIEVFRSGHYPTLDLVGGYDMFRTNNDFGSEADTGKIGVQLQLPIYAGGSVSSRTEQARSDFRAAQLVLDQSQRAVNRQVRDAYRGVLSTISRVGALKAATVSAKSALDSTQAGYEVGTRTIVDVLNVQRNLFSAQTDYAGSRYDYILNGLQLKQAAGNLTQSDLEGINAWLER
ncbi:MAG: TolC family outer membrane protein [gamma proteobacterium endosymbiont of Lamellibrachia anaximandri]|nr:TolC family outer membrane protein [gamma proteobacterium endosymbiont of Lamellibrachia anaximandri]MBL3619248.1 TolC family outer membrane protein [gamma proteobacterium endosymbiont of Lamellibrachia anaximandri]